ncbi:MAG TPA: hypothetical protein VFD41_08280 [Actinomycetales bacterium]|nr:hypothetical protein [Actinomycetales bacterium]
MMEALRAYAQAAAGLVGEPTAAKAQEAGQVLLDMVRAEVARTVARLGLVEAHEVDALRRRVIALERAVEDLRAQRPGAKKTAAKKAPAKKPAR